MIIVGAATIFLFGWLLYPLSDRKWRIKEDADATLRKRDILQHTRRGAAGRPNIVVILADDLGKTDLRPYAKLAGADTREKAFTPHLDALASESAVFTEAYCTSPISAPSRASMLTGRYQQRSGFELQPMNRYPKNRLEYYVYRSFIIPSATDWIVAPLRPVPENAEIAKQGLPMGEITLPEILRASGYATAIAGKWHLGWGEGFRPNERGFDSQYGFYEAFSLYSPLSDTNIVESRHTYYADRHIWAQKRNGTSAMRRDGVVTNENDYLTGAIAREANRFIRDKNKSGQPFFLYVPFSAPHTPFQVPRSYYDRYANIADHNKRVYVAMIAALDDAVGSILKTLTEEGLDENTLVFFASDNGGAVYTEATDNAPLAGGKFTLFEGGINIPFFFRWKGKVAPERVDKMAALPDIFSTALAASGVPLPGDRVYDGVNLLTHLGPGAKPPHEVLFWRSLEQRAVRHENWKLFVDRMGGRKRLYDLAIDKNERHDQSASHPEKVAELETLLANWERGLMAPLWPHVMDYRIRVGNESFLFSL